jgi:acyl-homoserine lactone acylase PvdQ
MIVETVPSLRSKFILSSGQSGHLFSQHFRDQTALWQNHDYIELVGAHGQMLNSPALLLRPAG